MATGACRLEGGRHFEALTEKSELALNISINDHRRRLNVGRWVGGGGWWVFGAWSEGLSEYKMSSVGGGRATSILAHLLPASCVLIIALALMT